MPRPGYTNLAPTSERQRLFSIICLRLMLNPNEHGARVGALDYALRSAAQGDSDRAHDLMMLGYNQAMLDYAHFPVSDGVTDALTHEDVQRVVSRLRERLNM